MLLMKERGVMVVGLSNQEWRLLLEKQGGSDRMQMISGVEEAVVRGLSQSEGTPDTQTDLKNSWNAWRSNFAMVPAASSELIAHQHAASVSATHSDSLSPTDTLCSRSW